MEGEDENQIDRNSLAYKIFYNFLTNKNYEANEDDLVNLVEEFKIDVSKLPFLFRQHLALIVAAFVHSWTGWHFERDYVDGKFTQEVYFCRFQKHMIHKLTTASRSHFHKAWQNLPEEVRITLSKQAVTALDIKCPPNMLGTIVFGSIGGDIVLKHHVARAWSQLNLRQIINWPHIQVVFQCPELCFYRKQATEYTRFLNSTGLDNYTQVKQAHHIVSATCNDSPLKRVAYSYDLIKEFISQYLAVQKAKSSEKEQIKDAETILEEFLADIKDINVNNSLGRNTRVVFRLSKVPYIRNKRLFQNATEQKVGFCELIDPRIQLLLMSFNIKYQIVGEQVKFDSLELAKAAIELSPPIIYYECTYCDRTLTTKKHLIAHLYSDHTMEQDVMCTACKGTYSMAKLSQTRWRHVCLNPVQNEPIVIV